MEIMTKQQNTIKAFNYLRNVRGAVIYSRILAELFQAARDDSKNGASKEMLDEFYQCMAGLGDYRGTSSRERVEYMIGDKFSEIPSGGVEDAFKDSKYSYEWFVEQHNKAVEIAKSFNREHLTIIK